MEGQPVFPGIQRGRRDKSGLPGEGCKLPDDEGGLLAEPGAMEVLRPVEASCFGGEVGLLPGIVRLFDVLLIRQSDMFFGDGVLQFDNMPGANLRVSESASLSSAETCA